MKAVIKLAAAAFAVLLMQKLPAECSQILLRGPTQRSGSQGVLGWYAGSGCPANDSTFGVAQ